MSKQTFIICLENIEGRTVFFERWGFTKAESCIDHMVQLIGSSINFYKRIIGPSAVKAVCYPTPDGYNRAEPVWSVTIEEFWNMVEAERSKSHA